MSVSKASISGEGFYRTDELRAAVTTSIKAH